MDPVMVKRLPMEAHLRVTRLPRMVVVVVVLGYTASASLHHTASRLCHPPNIFQEPPMVNPYSKASQWSYLLPEVAGASLATDPTPFLHPNTACLVMLLPMEPKLFMCRPPRPTNTSIANTPSVDPTAGTSILGAHKCLEAMFFFVSCTLFRHGLELFIIFLQRSV